MPQNNPAKLTVEQERRPVGLLFLQLRGASSFDSLVMEIGCTSQAEWAPGFRAIKTYLTFTP